MTKKREIIYLTYGTDTPTIGRNINTKRRKEILEKLKFNVWVYSCNNRSFIKDCVHLLPQLIKSDYVIIRIDGSGILDKFTILKLLKWRIEIFWEIHGFPEENLFNQNDIHIKNLVRWQNVKRKILSFLVNKYIFISKTLQAYAQNKLTKKQQCVIPNFIHINKKITNNEFGDSLIKHLFSDPNLYIIIWVGNGTVRWHALDTIENVAKRIYPIDKSIIFIIIGANKWHTFRWRKNLILLDSLPDDQLRQAINASNITLALYHKNKHHPLYFSPLKILDYMAVKKPIIATNGEGIKEMIVDGQNGLLTNNSTKNIVKNILYFKKNNQISVRFGHNAYKTAVQNYSDYSAYCLYRSAFTQT